MEEGLPNVFLFLCVRILFLLFDTKTASSTSVYLGRQTVVAINPLHLTYCVNQFDLAMSSSSHSQCVQSGVCRRSSVCSSV